MSGKKMCIRAASDVEGAVKRSGDTRARRADAADAKLGLTPRKLLDTVLATSPVVVRRERSRHQFTPRDRWTATPHR